MANENEVVSTDPTFASRKFIIVIIGLGLIFGGGILAAKMTGFSPSFPTLVGGVIGMTGLYLTGNVSERFLGAKVNAMVKMAALQSNNNTDDKSDDKPEDEKKDQ